VLPQSGISGTSARLPIDIRRFPWIRRLAVDYAFDFDRVARFFAGNPAEPSAWRDAIVRTQRHRRDRSAVADLLQAQQRQRGAPPEAVAAAAKLRDPQTVAVVTGQQAGLFGGPLFTLLKAITAVRLAERVAAEHHTAAVAIFWVDAEDHDWDEVKTCGVLDAESNLCRLSLGNPPGANEQPVARVILDDSAADVVNQLSTTLPPTEFSSSLLDSLRTIYTPGTSMSQAFGRLLESVLGGRGLVVFDASDPAAKPLVADVFVHELTHPGETSRLALQAGNELEAAGYHAQATPQESHAALFHLDGGREPIRRTDEGFSVGNRREPAAALLDAVRTRPQEFSPNVLLRPLVQDTLFPTVCYVAGPSELAYLAQLSGVYASFGIPMPLIQQRATATLLDSNAMRFLSKNDVALEALRQQDEAMLNQLLESKLPPSVDAPLEDALRLLAERMDSLAQAVPQIDPTLERAARSTQNRIEDELKKLHAKIIQASKRSNDTLRRQFKHAQAQAFPGGHPQEREVGFVYFLNKHGAGLVERLGDELSLDMGTHWVITI
jgi:bacillithiol biosynthesis cysteine-adding enzyme BshC